MMMSERPSGSVTGAGSSMGGNAPAVSIGNYKGVMLCNRPFAGVAAAAHGARGADGKKQPFRSAVVPKEALGLNPAREQRRVSMSGPKKNKNSALSRHKKWLYQLQKAKEQFRAEAEAKEQAEAEARRKLQWISALRGTGQLLPLRTMWPQSRSLSIQSSGLLPRKKSGGAFSSTIYLNL